MQGIDRPSGSGPFPPSRPRVGPYHPPSHADSSPHEGSPHPAEALLLDALSIQPHQFAQLAAAVGSPLDARDVAQALGTLLALGSRERVKHLVLGHPDLLLMGFELPGRKGSRSPQQDLGRGASGGMSVRDVSRRIELSGR